MNETLRVPCAADLVAPGEQSGGLDVPWARSTRASGAIRTPVRVIVGDDRREG